MGGSIHASTRMWTWGLGLAALTSCVDPFGFDSTPQNTTGSAGGGGGRSTSSSSQTASGPSTSSGSSTVGSSTGTNGSGGAGGATGGSAGSGGKMGAGGSGGGSGSGGSGGATGGGKPDAGPDASRDGGNRLDSGSDSGPLGAKPCPMNRFYPPLPDGDEATCPPHVTDLNQFVPVTAPVDGCTPLSHPGSDCPFYFFSWQNFMIATQPDAQGKPAFLSWGTIENVFGSGAGQPPPPTPVLLGSVTQAGGRQVLIDQSGHAI